LSDEELRQRACSELLRQAAIAEGLLDGADAPPDDGVLSEAASEAIEALLEKCVVVPEPSEEACRRHHAAHRTLYSTGERVRARHILFAVTQGVDVSALRQRAEATLLDVRCHDAKAAEDAFAKAAASLSNCPSGSAGGDLGWLTSERVRTGVRTRAVRPCGGGRAAAPGAQPLWPACGRGSGTRSRCGAAF
jgi:peptidyl-prolyl cis-trans isomerase C